MYHGEDRRVVSPGAPGGAVGGLRWRLAAPPFERPPVAAEGPHSMYQRERTADAVYGENIKRVVDFDGLLHQGRHPLANHARKHTEN